MCITCTYRGCTSLYEIIRFSHFRDLKHCGKGRERPLYYTPPSIKGEPSFPHRRSLHPQPQPSTFHLQTPLLHSSSSANPHQPPLTPRVYPNFALWRTTFIVGLSQLLPPLWSSRTPPICGGGRPPRRVSAMRGLHGTCPSPLRRKA